MPDQGKVKNRLLTALPPADFATLEKHLTYVPLELGQNVHEHGEVIDHVYFVESGFISAMTVLLDAQPLEIGLIGLEGFAGSSVILGAKTSYAETMCQTGGGAYRMPAWALLEPFQTSGAIRDVLLRYVCIFNIQVAQTAACNAHHELGQRLARWLLSACDRSESAELSLTQDLIAIMLGVRRSTVSVAAGLLQKAGFIRYAHGKITILDRVGLESATCECYEAVAGEYRRLFGEHTPRTGPIMRLVT